MHLTLTLTSIRPDNLGRDETFPATSDYFGMTGPKCNEWLWLTQAKCVYASETVRVTHLEGQREGVQSPLVSGLCTDCTRFATQSSDCRSPCNTECPSVRLRIEMTKTILCDKDVKQLLTRWGTASLRPLAACSHQWGLRVPYHVAHREA